MTSTPGRVSSSVPRLETPELNFTLDSDQLTTPDSLANFSPKTWEEIKSVQRVVQPSIGLINPPSYNSILRTYNDIEMSDHSASEHFDDGLSDEDNMSTSQLEAETLADVDQSSTSEYQSELQTDAQGPKVMYKRPKLSDLVELVKTNSGKLYPDVSKVEEHVCEYLIPLVAYQYSGSTLVPPKLPVGHSLQRYGFITSMANLSHEVTWQGAPNEPKIGEIVSAAVMSQVILDNRYVIRTNGAPEDPDNFDLDAKMILPISPYDVIRAERRLICDEANQAFKHVIDKVPFLPIQFELPDIEFPDDFVFDFFGKLKNRPTQVDYYKYFFNYSNIRFDGLTYAANCRHPTSQWDEHPWCVNCMFVSNIEMCPSVEDDDVESPCPYCFVMGPIARKNRAERWAYWVNREKAENKKSLIQSHKLKNYIRTQFDADIYSKTCDYNPDWDLGYFGFCRPSWAIPIFMSWQEYWFAINNEVNLLDRVNQDRAIFGPWAQARLDRATNLCNFAPFVAFHPLTELPTSNLTVTQPVPVYFNPDKGSKKRKRTPSRANSLERSSKSRPTTPITPERERSAAPRRSKAQSLDSRPRNLRTRNDTVDYTCSETPFSFELKEPEVTPSASEVTVEFMSAQQFYNATHNKPRVESLTVDSPARASNLAKSVAQEQTESETQLETETKTDSETQRVEVTLVESETGETPLEIKKTYFSTNDGDFVKIEKFTQGSSLPILSTINLASTPKSSYSSPCSLNLTSSSASTPAVVVGITPITRVTQPSSPDVVTGLRASLDLECETQRSEHESMDAMSTHDRDEDKPDQGHGDAEIEDISDDNDEMEQDEQKSAEDEQTLVHSTAESTLPEPPKLTQHLKFHPSAKNFKIISKPRFEDTTSTTPSREPPILSPRVTQPARSLEEVTPISRLWTSPSPNLTFPTQDLTQDVTTQRLLSINAAADLKKEKVLIESERGNHKGDDNMLDDMEEYPFHKPTNRVIDKVDDTLNYYRNCAYAPDFPKSILANCAGCTPLGVNLDARDPVRSRVGSYPHDGASMNLLQAEAVRLESNSRALAKMAENDAYLMPALLNYVETKRREADETNIEEVKRLNSLVNGLRLNTKMRENLIAENLGVVTAVRRRDNIERLTNLQDEIDHFVSRELDEDDPKLLPTKKKSKAQ